MTRRRDRELERALAEAPIPEEAEAEARAWEVIRAAHAERTPVHPGRRTRHAGVAIGVGIVALAIGLSPAGAKMGDLVSEIVGIGEEDAKPALRSLPAAGELLVESEQGVWIVRGDGSKRLLGDYGQASWSPRGLYAAATDGRKLVAVDPLGQVRWTVTGPGRVSDPRWGGIGFDTRIAYRSGDDLWVVAGDGTGARRVAQNVAPVAPAWRPIGESKVDLPPGGALAHVLTYVDESGTVQTVDAESATPVATARADRKRIEEAPSKVGVRRILSPTGSRIATVERVGATSRLFVGSVGGRQRVLFSARDDLTGPTWSPDGRWLMVGWPAADQWLFISIDRPNRVVAFDRISEQFDPGADAASRFPHVSGWILPQR